jgi:S-adenosylmethionine:tRNA ribosyltransferase-isomerase
MLTSDYDYQLPSRLIAQRPAEIRTASKLLVLDRATGRIEHRRFGDLVDYLKPGDCLIVNETKVRPSRLFGSKSTGAAVEVLLLDEVSKDCWEALCRPAKRLQVGARIIFNDDLSAEVIEVRAAGARLIRFFADSPLPAALQRAGRMALPPYIHEALEDNDRYQTVFAAKPGSVAAPTAGLHFTELLLEEIQNIGVRLAKITLNIGLDTFRPIQVEALDDHSMHSESYEIPEKSANMINSTKAAGGRIIAVGTTTVRALESAYVSAKSSSAGSVEVPVEAGAGRTNLFIRPGFDFKVVDIMLTNFHLPKSTLLVMISAFAGRENVRRAYTEAIEQSYRFYSFGDAMLIVDERSQE